MNKLVLIVLSMVLVHLGHAKKWKPDSSDYPILLNTSYSAPMVHFGVQIGAELPLKRLTKQFNTLAFLSNYGLKMWAKPRTLKSQITFEPSLLFYNHQFNHSAIGLTGMLHYRLVSHMRLFASAGIELGRMFQIQRDVIVFDERNNPTSQALSANGYHQFGFVFEFGYVFNKKKNHSVFYRAHTALLFPYNHLANALLRNEFGLKIISLQ